LPEFLEADKERDLDYQALYGLSHRIATLLQREVCAPTEWAACLDDLLGAVYSLFYAIHHDFSERPHALAPTNIGSVLDRAKDMAHGRVRTEGKWTAGFYLNNALFRIAAVYHRVLKLYTGDSQSKIKKLVTTASEKYKSTQNRAWKSRALKKVNCEVDKVKHTQGGIIKGRDAGLNEAIQATEELLALIEAAK